MKKNWLIRIVIVVAVSLAVTAILVQNGYEKNQAMQLGALAGLLALIVDFLVTSREHYIHKASRITENFEGPECGQTINIYQNCKGPSPGPNPGPSPTPVPAVTEEEVKKWLMSVDSTLTEACQKCIVDNAVRIWKPEDLKNVLSKDIAEQKSILQAMLVANCSSQCVVAPAGLDRKEVQAWVQGVDPSLDPKCVTCAVDAAMKRWPVRELAWVKALDGTKQANVLKLLLAINCLDCAPVVKVDPLEVQKLVAEIFVGAKPECYKCIVDSIVNLWTVEELADFKKMDSKSQTQIMQAFIALNCKENCTVVPSGVSEEEATALVKSSMPIGNSWMAECVSCLVHEIMTWSRDNLTIAMSKPQEERVKLLVNLATVDCNTSCVRSPEPTPHPSASYAEPCCGGR